MSGENTTRGIRSKGYPAERSGETPTFERRRWPRKQESAPEVTKRSALKPLEFSTRDLPKNKQFDAWKAHMEPIVDVRLHENVLPEHGFRAHQKVWNLGSLLIVQQSVAAHSFTRSAAKARSSPIDHWCISILRHGRTWIEVDGQVARNEPRKVEFRTLGHPFRGRSEDADSTILYMPRDLFGDASLGLDDLNNVVLSGDLARLLIDYVSSVEKLLPGLVAEDLAGVARTLWDVVTSSLAGVERKPVEERWIGLMERARRYIQQHLASPDLNPERLSQELGVSRTRLYKLFEPSGGVRHYIRKRRLLVAHVALSDPANNQRIIDIASAAGFDSPANFSRAFKTEFGYSPREVRDYSAILSGTRASSTKIPETFESWLAALGR